MKLITKIMIPLLIIAIGVLIMFGLFFLKEEKPKKAVEIKTKIVETETVTLQPIEAEIEAFGRTKTSAPVALYAEAVGTLMKGEVPFKPSQSFSKGDLILTIDDRQTLYELNSAKSNLLTALANVLPEIKVDFPEIYPVWATYFDSCRFDMKIPELPESDNQKIRLYLARFNVYNLYYAVRSLEIALEKHYIRAPFDGSIVSTALRVGSAARSGSLLGEIISLDDMEISVPIELNNIAWIDRTKPIRLQSNDFPGVWDGKISRIGSSINEKTQTIEVFISLENNKTSTLLNGVFLEVDIAGKTVNDAFAIPPKALYEDSFVYLIEDGKLIKRKVSLLRREHNKVIIDDGLENGDVVVIEAMQGVAPGMPAESKETQITERGN